MTHQRDESSLRKKCRLDIWLYQARFFKTRALASEFVRAGKVRISGRRPKKASAPVVIGDVLTFAWHNDVIVLKVLAIGTRRGPAVEAQSLYSRLENDSEDNNRP